MALKKISRFEKLKLKGSLKKDCFERWRLLTNAASVISGEEKTFFIEFYVVNPALSPKEPVLGFKSRYSAKDTGAISSQEFLQGAVLSGVPANKIPLQSDYPAPSFFMVRAGLLSTNGRCMNAYYPCGDINFEAKEYIVSLKHGKYSECVLSDDYTAGSVSVTNDDLTDHPEYMGNSGSISWNLRFSKSISFPSTYHAKKFMWCVPGGKVDFSGAIVYNNEEFSVTPSNSFGYYDINWGHDFLSPFFHLSTSFLSSSFTGVVLKKSSMVVHGEYKKSLTVLVDIEGSRYEFHADKGRKYRINHNCQEMPEDNSGVPKLHWTVSVENRKYVVDIDVFCETKSMFLRDYESPAGGRKVLRVLGSGNGNGRLHIYRKMKNGLELLEQTNFDRCVCEYGTHELPES